MTSKISEQFHLPNSAKMVPSVFGFQMLSAVPKHRFKHRPNAQFSI